MIEPLKPPRGRLRLCLACTWFASTLLASTNAFAQAEEEEAPADPREDARTEPEPEPEPEPEDDAAWWSARSAQDQTGAGGASVDEDVAVPSSDAPSLGAPTPAEVTSVPNTTAQSTSGEHADAIHEWSIRPTGFIRGGYEWVSNDPRYDFVGENGGFLLGNARLGLRGTHAPTGFSFALSFEGAADVRGLVNTPQAELSVRLRDAFVRWDFNDAIGVSVGQFKVPFMTEWMGRDGALPFASRAVGAEGVLVGRGFELEGIVVDRELGILVSSKAPIPLLRDLALSYHAMVFNGNGANQLLDDNGRIALVGRIDLHYRDIVRLGGSVLWNSRTEGPLPDRFEEQDLGFSADVAVALAGAEFLAHFTEVTTSFPTVGSADRTRLEFHVQGGYALPFVPFPLVPGYRFAYYDPWQTGGNDTSVDLGAFELMYHTIGVRLAHPDTTLGLTGWINYTFTVETASRSIANDRLEIIGQLAF